MSTQFQKNIPRYDAGEYPAPKDGKLEMAIIGCSDVSVQWSCIDNKCPFNDNIHDKRCCPKL